MSNILTSQINKLIDRGFKADKAREIAYAQQVRRWNIKPWTFELTENGKRYSSMPPEKREEVRRIVNNKRRAFRRKNK